MRFEVLTSELDIEPETLESIQAGLKLFVV